MPACPICFGEGHLDLRDMDAWFEEHVADDELARWEARGFVRKAGIVPCDECEETGIVSPGRLADIQAASRAHVEGIIAALDADEQGVPPIARPG